MVGSYTTLKDEIKMDRLPNPGYGWQQCEGPIDFSRSGWYGDDRYWERSGDTRAWNHHHYYDGEISYTDYNFMEKEFTRLYPQRLCVFHDSKEFITYLILFSMLIVSENKYSCNADLCCSRYAKAIVCPVRCNFNLTRYYAYVSV